VYVDVRTSVRFSLDLPLLAVTESFIIIFGSDIFIGLSNVHMDARKILRIIENTPLDQKCIHRQASNVILYNYHHHNLTLKCF
jgi:hypothetical protein